MDVGTLIGALSAGEREELLQRLTRTEERSHTAADDSGDASGCCGGARAMARRRAMMTETRQMCCGMS